MGIGANIRGLQHIGIPTGDIAATKNWYRDVLGFEVIYETAVEEEQGITQVAFLKHGNLVIETYQPAGLEVGCSEDRKPGPIDHIALDVDDIEGVYKQITSAGIKVLECGVRRLPFWQNGVIFFTVNGPNMEKVEFNQML